MKLRTPTSFIVALLTITATVSIHAQEEKPLTSQSHASIETREDLLLLSSLLTDAANKFHQANTSRMQSTTCRGCHQMSGGDEKFGVNLAVDWAGTNATNDIDFLVLGGRQKNPHAGLHEIPKADIAFTAAYLPGVGVVVQGSMPEPAMRFEASTEPQPEERLTNWEKARRALRGIPIEKSNFAEVRILSTPTHPELARRLAEVIQQNAQRIRGVKPDDKINLVVTFSPSSRVKSPTTLGILGVGNEHASAETEYEVEGYGEAGGGIGAEGGGFGPSDEYGGGGSASGLDGEGFGYEGGEGEFGFESGMGGMMGGSMSGVSQGDLYLRRGDYAKAIATFTKEVESRAKIKLKDIGETSLEKLAPVESQLKKLSQARIATGDFDEAQKLIEIIQKVAAIKVKSEQTFLRRLYLDMLGRMPTADESKAYLNNKSANRRLKLIEDMTKVHKQQKKDALKGRLPAQLVMTVSIDESAEEKKWTTQFIPSHVLGEEEQPTKIYQVDDLLRLDFAPLKKVDSP